MYREVQNLLSRLSLIYPASPSLYPVILLPDDFTLQGKSAATQ